MENSSKKLLRIGAGVAVVVLIAILLYGGRFFSTKSTTAQAAPQAQSSERKILYWYDAMDPQHTYNKPGKAPDGMDLVPKYADAEPTVTAAGAPAGTSAKPGARKILYWYDPMHPAYRADKAGIAPDCGMELVPKYAEEDMASMPAGTVKIATDKQQLMGVRTTTVERKALVREILTTAQIIPDERRIAHMHVKVMGNIEKVYVDFIGQLVRKGQPLFTLYSPDLVSTQEEYLIAKRGEQTLGAAPYKEVSEGAHSLLHSARERLRLWDISDAQIKKLDETGEVSHTMTFYAPISGFVTDRKAFSQASVNPDTELYTISDLSSVWATVDVFEYEVPYVHIGQQVTLSLSYYPGRTFSGRISYIYPTVDPQTRTVKARIDVANPHFDLKPQMFADAKIKVDYGSKLLVPQEAVLNSGAEQSVFVIHDGGMFEPRKVTVGPIIDGKAVILSGLKEGETIATSGNFLIDSESRLKSAVAGMNH